MHYTKIGKQIDIAIFMDISEEQEIIEKIAKNPKAFGVLFDAYYPIIYRYILKRTVDSAVASGHFLGNISEINEKYS